MKKTLFAICATLILTACASQDKSNNVADMDKKLDEIAKHTLSITPPLGLGKKWSEFNVVFKDKNLYSEEYDTYKFDISQNVDFYEKYLSVSRKTTDELETVRIHFINNNSNLYGKIFFISEESDSIEAIKFSLKCGKTDETEGVFFYGKCS